MSLKNHINKPEFTPYVVKCKDDTMQEHKVTRGLEYTVLGKLFGFLILKNDRGQLDKVSENRFTEVKK